MIKLSECQEIPFFAVAPTLQNSWNVCSVSSNVLLHGKTISFKQVFALIRKMDLD